MRAQLAIGVGFAAGLLFALLCMLFSFRRPVEPAPVGIDSVQFAAPPDYIPPPADSVP